MSKKSVVVCSENVLDMTRLFASVISDMSDKYNVVVDCDIDTDTHTREDYLHLYRHDTQYASQYAHNNVLQCYLKNKKRQVCVVANKTNFDAFSTENADYVREIKSQSLYRFRVSYDTFVDFMRDIIAFDNARDTTTVQQTTVDIALVK